MDPAKQTTYGPAAVPQSSPAPAQAPAIGAATAPAPAVIAGQTATPPPSPLTGGPGPSAAPAAGPPPGAVATAPVDAGSTLGQSASVSAAEAGAADQARPAATPAPAPALPAEAATPGARAAALIREQIDPLTSRIAYDTQELLRVGAEGPDAVTIRTILETFAAALEHGDAQTFAYTYSRAARPNIPQINDQVLPFRLGMQISGMFEGVLRDVFNEGFQTDPALRAASVQLLEQMAAPAKRALLGEPRELTQWQAPRI